VALLAVPIGAAVHLSSGNDAPPASASPQTEQTEPAEAGSTTPAQEKPPSAGKTLQDEDASDAAIVAALTARIDSYVNGGTFDPDKDKEPAASVRKGAATLEALFGDTYLTPADDVAILLKGLRGGVARFKHYLSQATDETPRFTLTASMQDAREIGFHRRVHVELTAESNFNAVLKPEYRDSFDWTERVTYVYFFTNGEWRFVDIEVRPGSET